jgi:hypothetical protein
MADKPKPIFEHPFWGKYFPALASGATLAVGVGILAYLTGGWANVIPACGKGISTAGTWIWGTTSSVASTAWAWLSTSMTVPRWTLLIAFVFLAVAIIAVAVVLKANVSVNAAARAQRREIELKGVLWRWDDTQDGDLDVVPICPKCLIQINPKHPYGMGSRYNPGPALYQCDHEGCGYQVAMKDEDHATVVNLVKREIHRIKRVEANKAGIAA